MQKINFQNLPSTATPINATNLNAIQDNAETAINLKADLAYINGTTPMGNVIVKSIRSKNLFDKTKVINAYLDGSGVPVSNPDNRVSDFIDVEGIASLTISGNATTSNYVECFYDSSKTFISRESIGEETKTISVPNNAKYIRVTVKATQLDVYQLEPGTTATTYSPYQELDNQEIYSTGEIKIGRWIDGKPLYRKVFEIPTTTISSSSTTAISIPTGNVNMVDIRGYVYVGTSQYRYSITGFRNLDFGVRNQSGGTQLLVGTTLAAEGTIRGVAIIDYTKN